MLALTTVFPLLCGLFIGINRRLAKRTCRILAVLAALGTSLLAFALIRTGMETHTLFSYGGAFSVAFSLDRRGKIFLALMAVLWPLSVLYATEYMEHEERENTFYMWYILSYAGMIPFCCAANLFTLYIFYEGITMLTLPLVWHKKDHDSIRAARSYVKYSIGCAAFGFACVVVLGMLDSLVFVHGGRAFLQLSDRYLNLVFLFAFFGFGVKAAVVPFSMWLPKAGAAPTPVTALLHAVAVVNGGVFAVQRVIYDVFGTSRLYGGFGQYTVLAASCLTIIFGAVMAVREHHVKRRLAYSTVSNLGYMLLGASLMTPAGETASLLHMICHSLTKIILFFCIGAVMVKTGRTQSAEMHGLGRSMPVTFTAFLIAALSLMGIPPLAGFASKYALITAAVENGGIWAVLGPASLIISAVLTAVYTMSLAVPAFFVPDQSAPCEKCDPSWRMLLPICLIGILMIAAGLYPGVLTEYLRY